MIRFPSTAHVGRIIPKEAFYKQLALTSALRERFVSDVRRITVEYVLTAESINADASDALDEILILSVQLKGAGIDDRILETIARQNAHKLVFLLAHEDRMQLALYCGKLYKTAWQPSEEASLELRGRNLAAIWQGFIEQIALADEPPPAEGLTIEERLLRQAQIAKLKRDMERLERMARKETQPRRKYALYQEMQSRQTELEALVGKNS